MLLGTFCVWAGGAAGCDSADTPAEPVWGKQPCAHCSMIIGDRHYAAQLVDQDGLHQHFDDIGCMVAYANEHGLSGERAWVRHESEDRWLDARVARFGSGARTPMNYGFVAGTQGALDYQQVRAAVLAKGNAP
jgi:copper chaperone NosL